MSLFIFILLTLPSLMSFAQERHFEIQLVNGSVTLKATPDFYEFIETDMRSVLTLKDVSFYADRPPLRLGYITKENSELETICRQVLEQSTDLGSIPSRSEKIYAKAHSKKTSNSYEGLFTVSGEGWHYTAPSPGSTYYTSILCAPFNLDPYDLGD